MPLNYLSKTSTTNVNTELLALSMVCFVSNLFVFEELLGTYSYE